MSVRRVAGWWVLLISLISGAFLTVSQPALAGTVLGPSVDASPTTSLCITDVDTRDVQCLARADAYDVDATLAARVVPADRLTTQARLPDPSGSSVAPSRGLVAPEATRIFRAVEPDELADLVGSGRYRTVPGLEGKYFFPTQQQAANFAELMAKTGRGPYCITSGCIDPGLLRQLEPLSIAGEGRAWFIPENLLPHIDDIIIHGPAG